MSRNWEKLGEDATGHNQTWPSHRSGCGMIAHGNTVFIYGGYVRTGSTMDSHGVTLSDMWAFDVQTRAWEKVFFPPLGYQFIDVGKAWQTKVAPRFAENH